MSFIHFLILDAASAIIMLFLWM